VLKAMAREYTPEWYLERIDWIKAAKRQISLSTDIIVGFPGETEDDFIETMDLLGKVGYDCVFAFKYSARPNTPSLTMIDTVPDEQKSTRLQVLLDRQREIQRANYSKQIGQILEVMVEGVNPARGQISGRSSQNKSVNFTSQQQIAPAPGCYLKVKITAAFPNSLVGESV
jgi:tRNA-2-methylthio-N6-dimethylallyladenosine synthase